MDTWSHAPLPRFGVLCTLLLSDSAVRHQLHGLARSDLNISNGLDLNISNGLVRQHLWKTRESSSSKDAIIWFVPCWHQIALKRDEVPAEDSIPAVFARPYTRKRASADLKGRNVRPMPCLVLSLFQMQRPHDNPWLMMLLPNSYMYEYASWSQTRPSSGVRQQAEAEISKSRDLDGSSLAGAGSRPMVGRRKADEW